MMKFFQWLPVFLLIAVAGSGQSSALAAREKDFSDEVSSLLNGAVVKVQRGYVEGRSVKYEIDIDSLTIDSATEKRSWLFAASMPALLFIKDSVPGKAGCKYIDVLVKAEGKEVRKRYLVSDLKQVGPCFHLLQTYLNGLKEANADSLTRSSEAELLKKTPLPPLIEKLTRADEAWGGVEDMHLNGFRFDRKDDKKYIYFSVSLSRKAGDQLVELWMNPL